MLSRHELSSVLSKVGCYKPDFLPTNDKRPISSSTPVGLLGVVIHRRFFRNHNSSKMCLRSTILDQVGDPYPPTPAPSGGQPPFDQKTWEANLDPSIYRWTHGYRLQKGDTSANCKGKLGGHKNDATCNNNKGGST
jgi:hypothetical protein